MYKFVPTAPYTGTGQPPIAQAQLSPLASGSVFGFARRGEQWPNWPGH